MPAMIWSMEISLVGLILLIILIVVLVRVL